MIKRDTCLWGWDEGGGGRRKKTHGIWQMWSQQDVLGWVIPSLWLLAFFRLLVSLQLNDGYLFQVTNPLTVWNPTLCRTENARTHMRRHGACLCVWAVRLSLPHPPAACLAVLLPSGAFLTWQKRLFLSQLWAWRKSLDEEKKNLNLHLIHKHDNVCKKCVLHKTVFVSEFWIKNQKRFAV